MIPSPLAHLLLTRTTPSLPRAVFWVSMKGAAWGKLDLGFAGAPVWRRQCPRLCPMSTDSANPPKLADSQQKPNGNRTRTMAVHERSDIRKRHRGIVGQNSNEQSRCAVIPSATPKGEESELEKGSFRALGFQNRTIALMEEGDLAEASAAATVQIAPWDLEEHDEEPFKRDVGQQAKEEEKENRKGGSELPEEIHVQTLSHTKSTSIQPTTQGQQPASPPSPPPSTSQPTAAPATQAASRSTTSPSPSSKAQPVDKAPGIISHPRNTPNAKPPRRQSMRKSLWRSAGREEELDDDAVAERKALLLEALNENGVKIDEITKGNHRMVCPVCEGGSSGEVSFSITIPADYTSAMYNCFRAKCGFQGGVHFQGGVRKAEKLSGFGHSEDMPTYTRPDPSLVPLDEECLKFFQARGISEATLDRNKVAMEWRNGVRHIAFPYMRNDMLVNVKYRTLDKKFSQVKGAEKILYGLNDVIGQEEFIIVEGEMDKLALNEAGIWNVASIPDGAPSPSSVKKQIPNPDEDKKFSFLWNCREVFEDAKKIIFAADNDAPGEALQAELTRRIGTFRCWVVDFPTCYDDTIMPKECTDEEVQDDDLWFRKDANEVLMKDGAEVLRKYVQDCHPFPIVGLSRFIDHADDLVAYYNNEMDRHNGLSTGWPSLDAFYKVVPGELSIVTGVPNSGKSEFLDALAVNLAQSTDCAIAFCSMEKHVHEHGRQLVEKFIGKPFFTGLNYTQGQKRLDEEELKKAILWIDAHFPLILSKKDELPDVDWVLEMARTSIFRYGIKGLVIDPYNELDHQRDSHMSETEYVSQMLAKVKRFAQMYGVHVWFVAHPRQMYNWAGEPPNLYDISGSAHFVNKADAGIVVHRNWKHGDEKSGKGSSKYDDDEDDDDSNAGIYSKEDPQLLVRILIRKMRNKTAGTVGECTLKYDPVSGRYIDLAAIAES